MGSFGIAEKKTITALFDQQMYHRFYFQFSNNASLKISTFKFSFNNFYVKELLIIALEFCMHNQTIKN